MCIIYLTGFFLTTQKYSLYFKSSVRKHIEKLHSFSPRVLRTSTFLKLHFHNNKVNSLIWTSKCSIWYSRFHFFCSPGLMLSTFVTKYWEVSSNYQAAKMWHMISSSSHADDQPVKKQFVRISHYHDKLTGILLNTFKCVKKHINVKVHVKGQG